MSIYNSKSHTSDSFFVSRAKGDNHAN